jgi:hypothetical protein
VLSFVNHRRDPAGWAAPLGVSREAIDVHLASDVIDLHIDSFLVAHLPLRPDQASRTPIFSAKADRS